MRNRQRWIEMHKIARDLEGFVHTPHGYLSKERYEALIAEHPEHFFPKHEDIPLLDGISDEHLKELCQ